MAQQRGTLARKECNECDLTGAPCFPLAIIMSGPGGLLLVVSHRFALPAHVLSTAGDAEYATLQKYVSHYLIICHLTH
jgi:hypothetical protein